MRRLRGPMAIDFTKAPYRSDIWQASIDPKAVRLGGLWEDLADRAKAAIVAKQLPSVPPDSEALDTLHAINRKAGRCL